MMDSLAALLLLAFLYCGYYVFSKKGLDVRVNGKTHNISIYKGKNDN